MHHGVKLKGDRLPDWKVHPDRLETVCAREVTSATPSDQDLRQPTDPSLATLCSADLVQFACSPSSWMDAHVI